MRESDSNEGGENKFSWTNFLRLNCDKMTVETLASFVRDNEHEVFAVITALQAQIDLLRSEQMRDNLSEKRFASMDRAVARLVSDTNILTAVSELAKSVPTNRRIDLNELMRDVVAETQSDFVTSQVGLSCSITKGISLAGHAAPLKLMFKAMLLAVLRGCKQLDNVEIVGTITKKIVSISFYTGVKSELTQFKRWPLGNLNSLPMNGEGIGFSAIDAMARFHRGYLSFCQQEGMRNTYMLSFRN